MGDPHTGNREPWLHESAQLRASLTAPRIYSCFRSAGVRSTQPPESNTPGGAMTLRPSKLTFTPSLTSAENSSWLCTYLAL